MDRLRKISRIGAVIILTLVAILIIASAILEPKVSEIIIEKTRENLVTKNEAGDIKFSLLKNFPRASVELKDLTLFSPGSSTDTLLYAGRVSISLKIPALIRKAYIIDRLSIEDADLNISEDPDGINNLDIFKKNERKDSSIMDLELRNVRILNTHLNYESAKSGIIADLIINSSHNSLSFKPKLNRLELSSNIGINSIVFSSFKIPEVPDKVRINASVTYDREKVSIESFDLGSDELEFSAIGSFDRSDSNMAIDFNIKPLSSGYIFSFPGISGSDFARDYNINATVSASGTIKGRWSGADKPFILASTLIERGSFTIPGKGIDVTNINGTGSLGFDPGNPGQTFSVALNQFSAKMDGSILTGSFSLKNLKNPLVDFTASGNIRASSIATMAAKPGFDANGTIRTNLRLYGRIQRKDKFNIKDIANLNRSVNMTLRSVNLGFNNGMVNIEKVKGNIMVTENIWFDGISFAFEGSEVAMNGRVNGFDSWLGDNSETLMITAGVWSNRFDFAVIDRVKQRSVPGSEEPEMKKSPVKLGLNLDIKLDSLVIGNFRSSMFSGAINYSNNFINISSFSLGTLKGTLEGNAALARLSSGRYLGKGWFDIGNIDINETFHVFNNFSQSYITEENLRGRLSGTLSITTELDSLFIPVGNTIIATGNYSIIDGELLNFEPVMALSRFVELTELSDIKFSELNNSIRIIDRIITIPSMDINSSAFDISLSGNHSFSGSYDYHLKLLLSDILSKKAIEKNREIDEFGVIEPDGLGKTSLYLKIEGDKDGSKVSYDMKNLKVDIKKDVAVEKETLKSILREEYGWYSEDTLPAPRKEETRKFRITWEEADSIRVEEKVNEEKVLPLKSLFKKKKKGGEG